MAKAKDVGELHGSHLQCRDKGHHWKHVTDKVTYQTKAGVIKEVERYYRCLTCNTKMTEVMETPSCHIKKRTYDYPDGYLVAVPKGQRIYVADVRQEVMRRLGVVK